MVVRSIRPALSPYIPNDRTGYLWIVTILGVIYTVIVAVARLFVKFRVLGIDDYLLGFATVRSFVLLWIILLEVFAPVIDPAIFRSSIWRSLFRYSSGFQMDSQIMPILMQLSRRTAYKRHVLAN